MVAILMMPVNLATKSLIKIKSFWNKSDDVIIFVHDVTNKILLHESNYIVKFNNLGLALGMALSFYAGVAKGLKLKVKNF